MAKNANPEEVRDFYNKYIPRQTRVSVNLRHLTIYNELLKFGLKKSSNVLEVGCGIGTLTSLITKKVTKGKLYGTDISDKSIEICRQIFAANKNYAFEATDMSKDLQTNWQFDFVVFADVLEHIPIEQWENLFQKINKTFTGKTKVLINYPNPKLNKFYRATSPEKLQIIDQELYFKHYSNILTRFNLELVEWKPHSIFMKENDYILAKFSQVIEDENFTNIHWTKISFRKQILRLRQFLKS